ncbi:MAG TPA: hypothetical protein VN914_16330, partial [Polyangia bacterium]|nr:hypothetical protein [Polyangia bacterium]
MRRTTGRNAVAVLTALGVMGIGATFLVLWLGTDDGAAAWAGYGMKTNTALCLVLSSLALLLAGRGRFGAGLSGVLAAITAAMGIAVLFQYLTGINLHIDQLIAQDFPSEETRGYPNRMAPNTAILFVCAGLALLALPRRGGWPVTGQALALTVLGVSILAGIGYLYQSA